MTIEANGLRESFTRFFVDRGHLALPPASLIPHDPTILFTIAGMVPLKPYFLGEQVPPAPRATTIQPCIRTLDIDVVGTTARHTTLFEMLGNFSFGDYFKEGAIPLAWELITEVIGFDPDRLWVTVHESDDDAGGIWQEVSGLPPDRIQKMGEDNFWKMGDVGPCGPCSEIYFDRGEAFGAPGGPAYGGQDRYIEFWNLVFMQYERQADGTLLDLPKKNIDTGAGLERILALIQDAPTVFETDAFAPLLEEAARLTGRVPGAARESDVALRILADHARAMTFLISDGVFPSNEGRGYVLRRIIRRAVRHAHQLGVSTLVTPELVDAVVGLLGGAYPRLVRDASLVRTVVTHEEEAFRRTLRAGDSLIADELARGDAEISGEVAFRLHDTFGFPIDLTVEVAESAGVRVDRPGFEALMAEQRARARSASHQAADADDQAQTWRDVLSEFGRSEFVGYRQTHATARILALVDRGEIALESTEAETPPAGSTVYDLVLDVTPCYPEGGGQVGDTGVVTTETGAFRVLNTNYATEGLIRHSGYLARGEVLAGQEAEADVDAPRRDAIRRNHTATHLLQAALREVLGEHVGQQGSLVAPDRLRFDFSHFAAPTRDELRAVEEIVNAEVITDHPVRVYETTKVEAEQSGAIAFFGDKYGDVVRVVEAGDHSVELCGGTHVHGLGMIGLFRIVSEGSIGANTRRIEAITGERSLENVRVHEDVLEHAAHSLRTSPLEVPDALEKVLARQTEIEAELRQARGARLGEEAVELAAGANGGRVVARRDGLNPNELRELALAVRARDGVHAVALVGTPDDERVALVVALDATSGLDARAIAAAAAAHVGGGGGGSPEVATAGGRSVAGIPAALEAITESFAAS